MKINKKKDFTGTLNLQQKTIEVNTNLIKKEEYYINRFQDINKYNEAINQNSSSKYAINIAQVPLEIDEKLSSTEIINQIFKDIFLRYQLFKGNVVYNELGFIEKDKILDYSIAIKNINEKLRYRANEMKEFIRNSGKMCEEVNSLGTIINYNNRKYTTINNEFKIDVIKKFFESYKKGNVYSKTKPDHFCTNCKRTLLKKEVVHEKSMEKNIYILYKVKEGNVLSQEELNFNDTYLIVNTIRPWTVQSSNKLVICKDTEYSLVQIKEKDKIINYIIASELVEKVMENSYYLKYKIIHTFNSIELLNTICYNPLYTKKEISIIFASRENVIVRENGTGINIFSPNNTYLDYLISEELGLSEFKTILSIDGIVIDSSLRYSDAHYKVVDAQIIEYLRLSGNIFSIYRSKENILKCKNCSTELVYRNSRAWYIKRNESKLERINTSLDELAKKVKNYNNYNELSEGILKVKKLNEIKISSQNGNYIPIPVFYCADCGKVILTNKSIEIIIKLFNLKGTESWDKMTPEQILEGQVACSCGCVFFFKEECTLNNMYNLINTPFTYKDNNRKTINVCIESKKFFLKKIVASSFNDNFDEIINNLDIIKIHSKVREENNIIGKTYWYNPKKEYDNELLNIDISVRDVVKKYGTDVLRLWTAFKANKVNIELKEAEIILINSAYKKMRRTFKFLLSNLYDYNPNQNKIELDERNDIDKYAYVKLIEIMDNLEQDYLNLDFNKLYNHILEYCVNELCHNYFDSIKYGLYVTQKDSHIRRSTQSTMYEILNNLLAYVGPILPFTFEELWPFLWNEKNKQKNPLLHRTYLLESDDKYEQSVNKWDAIFEIKEIVYELIEVAKRENIINNSLQAKVVISNENSYKSFIERNYDDIIRCLNISKIEFVKSDFQIKINKADGIKCPRCNNYSEEIGKNISYRYLCPKCAQILDDKNNYI